MRDFKIYGILGIELDDLLEDEYGEDRHKKLISKLIDIMLEIYFNYETRAFITNCELGTSLWCGEIISNLLKHFPKEIYLYSILPFKNRENSWTVKYQKRYKNLLKKCNINAYLEEEYKQDCFKEVNNEIISNSNTIFAVCNLKNIYKLNELLDIALQKNKPLILLDTETLKTINFY